MAGLVNHATHPRQLALEVRHALMEHGEVVARGAPVPGQLLFQLGPDGVLGVDILPSRAQPALALGDRRPEPLGLLPSLGQILFESLNLCAELGRPPTGTLGRQLGAAHPTRLD